MRFIIHSSCLEIDSGDVVTLEPLCGLCLKPIFFEPSSIAIVNGVVTYDVADYIHTTDFTSICTAEKVYVDSAKAISRISAAYRF